MNKQIKVEFEEQDDSIEFSKKKKIYQAKVKGLYRTIKTHMANILLAIYFLGPYLRYDRGEGVPNQALLIDLTARKYHFFGIEIWPQEVYYVIGLLIFAAIGLFFITSILGRVWCGYICPQTVFSDMFYRIEEFFEGSYQKRIRQDNKKLTFKIFIKKLAKQITWVMVSLFTGITLTIYFTDAYEVLKVYFVGDASYNVYFWSIFIAFTTYAFAGYAKEYICIYACPYSRFQGAMMDEDSLVVSYDEKRGEPRGKLEKQHKDHGDCIDCMRCVVVCPVGIDIRDGQQYECINCGLCVDACDEIMLKVDKPKGLIRYDTLRNMVNDTKIESKIMRPRTIVYGLMLLLLGAVLVYGLMFKQQTLEVSLKPNRSPLYVTLGNGDIRNIYEFKIINKSHSLDKVNLKVSGLENAKIILKGTQKIKFNINENVSLKLKTNGSNSFKVFVDSKAYNQKQKIEDLSFNINYEDKVNLYKTKFTHP